MIIEALGTAGLANVANASNLAIRAYQDYGRALAMTNGALCDPHRAVKDDTLIAVWFLGIFEVSRDPAIPPSSAVYSRLLVRDT